MIQQPLVVLSNITKHFFTDEIETEALSAINLTIQTGEYVAITGPSGCGKSTLLSLLGLLDKPSTGSYTLAGHDVSELNKSDSARFRNQQVGFVFQAFNLISDLSIADNVAMPLTFRSDISKSEIDDMVRQALESVDMLHRANHFPSQLSGGQQQRVAVARAIAGSPALILADEPTGNLDSKNAQMVMELLHTLHQKGATICMVTHDPKAADQAQRVIEVFDGKIVADHKTANLTPLAS